MRFARHLCDDDISSKATPGCGHQVIRGSRSSTGAAIVSFIRMAARNSLMWTREAARGYAARRQTTEVVGSRQSPRRDTQSRAEEVVCVRLSFSRYFVNKSNIVTPCRVRILCSSYFSQCNSLSAISFEPDLDLRRIESKAFDSRPSLESISVPPRVQLMYSQIDFRFFSSHNSQTRAVGDQ
jgi:hypothetical protein